MVNEYSKIDILVNNAAFIDYQPKLWDEVISTNSSAVFELSVQAAQHMKTGKIIQLASVASFSGARNIAGYSTSKHGLIGMIKCLSNELMPMGINVNGIALGVMKTDMHQSILDDEIRRREVEGRIPAARMGEASDLNGALIFLASDASNYVTYYNIS